MLLKSKLLKIIEYGIQSTKKFEEMKQILEKDGPLLRLPNIPLRSYSPDHSSVISFPHSSIISTDRGDPKNLLKNTNRNSIVFSLQHQH